MRPTDFAKSLTDFLTKYLPGEMGISHNTISSYRTTFMLFITFIEEKKNIKVEKLSLIHLTKKHVLEFLDWLQTERKSSDATRNVRLAGLHSFFRYLQYTCSEYISVWQEILSIKFKKTGKAIFNHLTLDEIKILFQQPDLSTKKGQRDLAMLALMYDSAARVSEITDLTPSMVRLKMPFTVKLIGKGNKARIVPLMEQEIVHLKQYMENNKLIEPCNNNHPLFFNCRKEKLTRAGVSYLVKSYANMARDKGQMTMPSKISPHVLRHSKAMHLLQAGVNLVYIRDILGHESVVTTELYAHADSMQKREAIENAYNNKGFVPARRNGVPRMKPSLD